MKFKKYYEGDRVKVYGGTERTESDSIPYSDKLPLCYRYGDKGTVSHSHGMYGVSIDLDNGGYVIAHPMQLVKLRKKKK